MPQLPTLYLKHRGLFSMSQLLQTIQKWLDDNKYRFHAPKYKLKANAAEYEIKGVREINEYVRFTIKVHIWTREMTEVEIVQEGEKKKMDEGKINMDLEGQYDLDYQKRFGGNKFFQWLQDFYHEYIIRQTINDVWEDDLFLKINQLMSNIKKVLGTEVSQ